MLTGVVQYLVIGTVIAWALTNVGSELEGTPRLAHEDVPLAVLFWPLVILLTVAVSMIFYLDEVSKDEDEET